MSSNPWGGILEVESRRKNPGRGILEEESLRWKPEGGILAEESWRRIQEEGIQKGSGATSRQPWRDIQGPSGPTKDLTEATRRTIWAERKSVLNHCVFLKKVARPSFSPARERGNMHEVPRLRTKVGRRKRPNCRQSKRPVPESPPEPLQCEHCLRNYNIFCSLSF